MEYHTIELPLGISNFFARRRLRKRLNKKLEEYYARHAHPKNPREWRDAWHKIHVLSVLLDFGRVDIGILAAKLALFPEYERFLLERAFNTIRAYACGYLDILRGGTGLPR